MAESIKHSFLAGGPNFTGILDEDGKPVWDTSRRFGRDGWVLPSGNVLICWSNVVKEFRGRSNEVVWEYEKPVDESSRFFGCAQRLPDGNTMICHPPRIVEITPGKKEALRLPARGTYGANPVSYFVRKMDNGNFLATELAPNGNLLVIEVDAKGKEVRKIDTGIDNRGHHVYYAQPLTACVALPDDDILVLSQFKDCVRELDKAGKVVWELSNKDLEKPLLHKISSIQRLPNGNTVIGNYRHRAEADGPKLVEVTRDKKVVWTYEGEQRVTCFQILTTNGKPVEGPVLR